MIALTPQLRVLVAVAPVDFRAGIDGLAQRVRQVLAAEPMSGALFVFRNRRGTAVKLLAYDGQGFWLCHKRLSQGRFRIGRRRSRGRSWRPRNWRSCSSGDWSAAAGVPHPAAGAPAAAEQRHRPPPPAAAAGGCPPPDGNVLFRSPGACQRPS